MRTSQAKTRKKWREIKKEANKKEHCLSASRVFDNALMINGEIVQFYYRLFFLRNLKILHEVLFIICKDKEAEN